MTQAMSPPPARSVLGCEIDRLDMREAVERCEHHIEARVPAQHMAVNAAKVVAMQDDAELLRLVNSCEIVTADGQAVVWASRLLRDPLPSRVTGIDLMQELLALAERKGYGVYVLGRPRRGPGAGDGPSAARCIPELRIVGHRDGYFSAERGARCRRGRSGHASPTCSSWRCPRRARSASSAAGGTSWTSRSAWASAARSTCSPASRAVRPGRCSAWGSSGPIRLAQEPRRLLRRYLVGNWRFITLTLRHVAAGVVRDRLRT